jgi:hypothetical protein
MKKFHQLILLVGVVGSSSIARADTDAAAAFARGKAALKANKVHAACDAFAESEKLEAALDTEIALASCLEQDGQLVAAAKLYRTASDKDTDGKRKKISSDKATKLEAKAPKLRFAINPKPEGIVIKVDGVEVAGTNDVMVDLGPHEVTATAPGYEGHASAPVDREGQILDVILRMEATTSTAAPEPAPMSDAKPAPAAVSQPAEAEPASEPAMPAADAQPSHRRRNAMIVGGAGVAALIGAAVFYQLGSSKFDDEHALCPGHLCASDADRAMGDSLGQDGRTDRKIAVGLGIGGAVLVGAGAFLFATAHHESSPVALRLDRNGAGVTYTVGF